MSGTAAGQVGDLGDDLLHVLGARSTGCRRPANDGALLLHDGDLVLDGPRVVRADLRAEAVLERRDDAAAVGVVLRVGAGDHVEVERQPDLVAADLDVALLHDVEQADLDALGQVGQLVDAEDAAVGARDQAVVDRQLVGEVAALGHLDRVDLADEVGDGDVRRGQLLAVAAVAARSSRSRRRRPPRPPAARQAWQIGAKRIVVDLAAGDRRHLVVEQADQHARDARLGLAALAEEDRCPARRGSAFSIWGMTVSS